MNYAAARRTMVENQLRTNQIVDPLVIDAMRTLPREAFVPDRLKGVAYVDEDIPLGGGRYMVEPLILARLVQEAAIGRDDVVLDIGCNSGYGTAVMATMANTVVALESDEALAAAASHALEDLSVDNAAVVQGPLIEGYARGCPYDVIVIEGAIAELPSAIADQLAEGGRLVCVMSVPQGMGLATLFTRMHGTLARRPLFEASTPLLPGFEPREKFVFL